MVMDSRALDDVLAGNELRRAVDRFRDEFEVFVRCVTERIAISSGDRLVSPDEACEISGYSKRQLHRLVAEQRLTNHGRPRAPLYRVNELPVKAGQRAGPVITGPTGLEIGSQASEPRPADIPALPVVVQPMSDPRTPRRGRDAAIEARARQMARRPRRPRTG
ncbi:MAG TPA: hypothetical protein VF263_09905 [Longimicrobiaceae bacterium]